MKVRAQITALGFGGSFIGEVVSGDPGSESRCGKKVFVRGVVPGETVDVEIRKEEARFIIGEARHIAVQSPERVTPPCPYVGVCGGCDLQHLDLAAQRRLKVDMVATMLAKHAKASPRHGVVLRGEVLPGFHYRRRIQLHLDRAGNLGFYRAGSTTVAPIDVCLLAMSPLNEALQTIRPRAAALAEVCAGITLEHHAGVTVVILRLRPEIDPRRHANAIESAYRPLEVLPGDLIVRHGERDLYRRRGGVVLAADERDSAGHFSQVNPAANEVLIETVLEFVASEAVTDLYAGAGNFALPLARRGRRVTAVELDPALVLAGSRSARAEGLAVTYVPLDCDAFVARHPLEETVVLDPPRAGARAVVGRLDPAVTRRIVYVSCDLPSLTRDIKVAIERGYTFDHLFVVDMFPQTHHVETVAVLSA
jgi:23S rRNA (uracil1939-C5)-methyltransferase